MAGESEPAGRGAIEEWPFDEGASEVDGVVGVPWESHERHSTESSQIYVSVSADLSAAIGLEDDVRLLVQAFATGGAALCREITEGLLPRSAGRSESPDQQEVDVALHGLGLDSNDEEELRDLIRMLVQDRTPEGRS
jgi:hypothetical protein